MGKCVSVSENSLNAALRQVKSRKISTNSNLLTNSWLTSLLTHVLNDFMRDELVKT